MLVARIREKDWLYLRRHQCTSGMMKHRYILPDRREVHGKILPGEFRQPAQVLSGNKTRSNLRRSMQVYKRSTYASVRRDPGVPLLRSPISSRIGVIRRSSGKADD